MDDLTINGPILENLSLAVRNVTTIFKDLAPYPYPSTRPPLYLALSSPACHAPSPIVYRQDHNVLIRGGHAPAARPPLVGHSAAAATPT